MIGVDAWMWIFITVEPLWTLSIDNSSMSEHSHTAFHLNSTTVIQIAESILQPFFIEFLSISAGCVLSLWFTMRDDPRLHIEYKQSNTETRLNEQNEAISGL